MTPADLTALIERLEQDKRGWRESAMFFPTAAATVALLTEAAAALREMAKDAERLDWLEGEREREVGPGPPRPRSLFRQNLPITRARIDAARSPK